MYTDSVWVQVSYIFHVTGSLTINQNLMMNGDCFYYCSYRNKVMILFGTLKVQSNILTEVSGRGLLIVVITSTFLKRKDMLKVKR